MRELIAVFQENRRYGAQAPTGSGKSFAYLAAIAANVIIDGRKAVVSTETKQLQSQIVNKDLPAINEASRLVANRGISYAALKGRQNYVCLYAVLAKRGIHTETAIEPTIIGAMLQRDTSTPIDNWLASHVGKSGWSGSTDDIPVGKHVSAQDIDEITVSSQECLGSKCPFRTEGMCYADQAIEAALEADVIVTNHTLVAIELATGAPIVLTRGERKADILVIDEAHSMESVVRGQESVVINPVSIGYAIKQAVTANTSAKKPAIEKAEKAAVAFQRELALASSIEVKPSRYHRSNAQFHRKLDMSAIELVRALEVVQRGLPDTSLVPAVIKARSRLGGMIGYLNEFLQITEDAQSAIWVEERAENSYVLVIQSIQLSTKLWSAINERTGDADLPPAEEDAEPPHAAAVAAVSATLPEIVARNILGKEMGYASFSSPFAIAYQSSRVLIPCDTSVMPDGRFNHAVHQEWAVSVISDLVIANDGSALVLSTSSAGAQYFYEVLSRTLPSSIPLIYHKDGSSKAVVDKWKADQHSVLIATRGMMTGVDAPGLTCSLVIIDRVPRAPTGITNELRVESLLGGKGTSRYLAEAKIYGGDAAVLLEQAAGRLIRSENDRGLLAVLDPRLCPKQPFSYRSPYIRYYRDALGAWGGEIRDVKEAVKWLEGRRNARG